MSGIIIPILFSMLIVVCLAMIGLILLQRGKGGGLVGLGGGGVDQAFGTHAASTAQKLTAILAILFIVLTAILGKLMMPSSPLETQPIQPAATAPANPNPKDKATSDKGTPPSAKAEVPADAPNKGDAAKAPANPGEK